MANSEVIQNGNQKVLSDIVSGKTTVSTDIAPQDKKKQVFNFIANETKSAVHAQMKQLITGMDVPERKHYEAKVSKFDE